MLHTHLIISSGNKTHIEEYNCVPFACSIQHNTDFNHVATTDFFFFLALIYELPVTRQLVKQVYINLNDVYPRPGRFDRYTFKKNSRVSQQEGRASGTSTDYTK